MKTRKLTAEQALAIVADGRAGAAIAADFGISSNTVSWIKNGRSYSDVTGVQRMHRVRREPLGDDDALPDGDLRVIVLLDDEHGRVSERQFFLSSSPEDPDTDGERAVALLKVAFPNHKVREKRALSALDVAGGGVLFRLEAAA
jgi:hypothetical protein